MEMKKSLLPASYKLLLLLLPLAGWAAVYEPSLFSRWQTADWSNVRKGLLLLGPWGPAGCIGAYIAFSVLCLPCTPITLLLGWTYGIWGGMACAASGTTAGACVAFFLSRRCMRPYFQKILGGHPVWRKLEGGSWGHGWRAVMLSRTLPVFPFHLVNYAFGISRIPFGTYALFSGLFMLPATFTYVTAGATLESVVEGNADPRQIILTSLAALGACSLSLIPRFLHRLQDSRRSASKPSENQEAGSS